jgi:hypothetical protein
MIDFDIEKIENHQIKSLAKECADAGVDPAEIDAAIKRYDTSKFPDANLAALRAVLGDLLKAAQSVPRAYTKCR